MKKKKRAITLIEIMIVILLIGLIGGALAYNMRGSLDEGKRFKTKQNINRIEDILLIEYAKGNETTEEICNHWQEIVGRSPLVKRNGREIIVDGWGEPFKVTIVDGEFHVTSGHFVDEEHVE